MSHLNGQNGMIPGPGVGVLFDSLFTRGLFSRGFWSEWGFA